MTAPSRIVVLGAGSLRCAPEVLASLVQADLPQESAVWLQDEHAEALDLAERLAHRLVTESNLLLRVVATPDPAEALEGAETIILCVGGGLREREGWFAIEGDEEAVELLRLERIRRVMATLQSRLESLAEGVTVINLARPTAQSGRFLPRPAIHLDWPEPLPGEQRVPRAHQMLRWARGEDPMFDLLERVRNSPLVIALRYGEPMATNLYDPDAATELAVRLQGVGAGLLRLLPEM
ncbi:MAG: hypothetical protein C4341_07160 [Armatimonadota bacterium]